MWSAPASARRGTNGPTLMNLLETVELESDARWPPSACRCNTSTAQPGFPRLLRHHRRRPHPPWRHRASPARRQDQQVKAIVTADGELPYAHAGQAVTLTLEDEIDISRGDMLAHVGETAPKVAATLTAHLVWMDETPLTLGKGISVQAGRQKSHRPGQRHRRAHRRQHPGSQHRQRAQAERNRPRHRGAERRRRL